MKVEALIEVIEKLTGACYPYGSHGIDQERYSNLELKIAIVDTLMQEIEEASCLYDRPEASIKKISQKALQYIDQLRCRLSYIKGLEEMVYAEDVLDILKSYRFNIATKADEFFEVLCDMLGTSDSDLVKQLNSKKGN